LQEILSDSCWIRRPCEDWHRRAPDAVVAWAPDPAGSLRILASRGLIFRQAQLVMPAGALQGAFSNSSRRA